MPFHTYLLRCANGSFHAGHTDDLDRRMAEHRSGTGPGDMRARGPVELVWAGDAATREDAIAVAQQIGGWPRAEIEALIAGDRDPVGALAQGRVVRDAASASPASPGDDRTEDAPPPPVIVLVRPQLGENIGKAARAMLNFGLTELRLVAPRDGWPNPSAGPAASGADLVLERASVHDTLADAIADCPHVYATTVRRRGLVKPVVTPAEAAVEIHGQPGRTAILFGPERSGLDTDDVAVARAIVTVPINPQFGSLNLAQAVILMAYEWSKHVDAGTLAQPTMIDADPPAPQGELDGMIAQLDAMLVSAGFFFPPDRVPTVRRTLRSVLTKPGWSAQEVRVMRGVLSAIDRPRPPRA